MSTIKQDVSKHQLVAFLFSQDALAASQTDVQLLVLEAGSAVLSVDEVYLPFEAEVVGISWSLSAAGSAGTLTIGVTSAGTENSSTTQTITTAQRGYARIPRGTMKLAAGGQLGVEITTDGSWNGTTSDLAVWVWVLCALEGV